MPLACRFYANEFPELEDTVIVKVNKIAEMGAYVTLIEYNNKEGMILLSELSRRRIRSVNKLIRVGRSECVVVIRVDQNKGYIDLSKRRVYSRDLLQCEERFSRAKAVNGILRHVADQLGYTEDKQLEELYEKTAWHFDRKLKKKAAANEVFKKALTDPTVFDECDISDEVKNKLLEEIRKKLTPQALKIRADIEVSCFDYEGIEAVKAALIKGKECSTEQMPIKIQLIAAPSFVVTAQTMERVEGVESVNKALEAIRESIEGSGGTFKVVMPPKVVTDQDEEEIKKRMELMGLNEEEQGESGSEQEDDDGLVAPKGLDQEADQADEQQGAKKKASGSDSEGDD
ncbi:Eukaryotic translation initiation factor 2 subunit 1 [Aphelenchoides bicaudatus]|nr:Eukaryotic translation initiation factor 2 subunit 1 [Aphelenchoides bicaudatus]